MHLACFILLFVANVVPSGSGNKVNLNWRLIKALMSFATIPFYIWQICYAFGTLDKQYISYSSESSIEEYKVLDEIYVSNKYGNGIIWIKLEIFAFYCNLIVGIVYLAKARCTTTEDNDQEDFGYMIVCKDHHSKEEHLSATNVQIFNVEGPIGREKL